MTVLVDAPEELDAWLAELRTRLPGLRVLSPDTVDDPDSIHHLVAWRHSAEDIERYRNLRAVHVLGAGVEQFTPIVPDHVPIVRLADESMAAEMAAYVLHWVVHVHRRFSVIAHQQRERRWVETVGAPSAEYVVGVLGYGTIGAKVGHLLREAGYPVIGWVSRPRADAAVELFAGPDQLDSFLGACKAVVNVLPHTAVTRGIMDARRFASCRPGALYVNIGRGATTVETDLVEALDRGRIGHAVLDVTETEPLPRDSPLWDHPQVDLTPHVSGVTQLSTAAGLIAANVQRVESGGTPFPIVERGAGY